MGQQEDEGLGAENLLGLFPRVGVVSSRKKGKSGGER